MLYGVIMAGGAGTRFWPWSRENRPKQLLEITGNKAMIEITVERIGAMIPAQNILVITTSRQRATIKKKLIHIPEENIIAEPFGRDTAPCIGLAAIIIEKRDKEGIMAVMPADQIIKPEDKFIDIINIASSIAKESNALVALGINPSTPSPHYGYIQRGDNKETINGAAVYEVKGFKEKPDMDTARRYVDSGEYYWNGGVFVWSVKTILSCIERFMPELSAGLRRISQHLGTPEGEIVIKEEYKSFKKVSIDYGVMEKAKDIKVIETDLFWDDVGSWKAIERLNKQDESGNTILANHSGINTNNCVIVGEKGHLIATINVSDLIIVHTADATLVCNKDKDEDIKELVKRLKEQGFDGYL